MVALNATVEAPISARAIDFKIVAADGSVDTVVASLDRLIIAGWAGRDVRAVEDHVRELAALGVKPPSSIPAFYQAGIETLTTAPGIQVLGPDTSGEVEAVFVSIDGDILVGVGSDHTDRRAEADSIALSKQMCPKPVSQALWRYSDVAEHWDSLVLRSYATIDGQRLLYQEGAMSTISSLQTCCSARLAAVSRCRRQPSCTAARSARSVEYDLCSRWSSSSRTPF